VIRAIADRVYVMQRGRIVEEGPTESVFASPRHAYTKARCGHAAVDGELVAGPRLMTARLIRLNRSSRDKTRARIIAAAGFGVMLAFVGRNAAWLRRHDLAATAWRRLRRPRGHRERHSSRTASRAEAARICRILAGGVPVRSRTARWEALLIETLPATAAVAALTVLGASAGVVLAIAGDGHGGALLQSGPR